MDSNPIQWGVLIKRGEYGGYPEIPKAAHTQTKGHVRTQKEGKELQAKKRGLRRNLTCQHFDTGPLGSKSVRK